MSLILQTAAVALPVTLAEARLHLRVDSTTEDALITALLGAATLDAEHITGRALMPQKWQLTVDSFAHCLDLQRAATAVDSVIYVAVGGTPTTLANTVYQFVGLSDYRARVVLAYGQSWPDIQTQPEAVRVLFSCGYANAAAVPEPVKAWIKLRVGALFENRQSVTDLPTHALGMADSLLDRYRVWSA